MVVDVVTRGSLQPRLSKRPCPFLPLPCCIIARVPVFLIIVIWADLCLLSRSCPPDGGFGGASGWFILPVRLACSGSRLGQRGAHNLAQ